MHRECNVTKRVRTDAGLRYCPVVLSANGRIKPDTVLVNSKPEHHPEGAYHLEWRENSKRKRLSVGKDAQDAAARRLRKEAELNAMNNGVQIVENNGNGHSVLLREQEVMHTYWRDIKFADSVVRVSHKPDLGWTPKAYKEREIPIPAKLTQSLKKLQANPIRQN